MLGVRGDTHSPYARDGSTNTHAAKLGTTPIVSPVTDSCDVDPRFKSKYHVTKNVACCEPKLRESGGQEDKRV